MFFLTSSLFSPLSKKLLQAISCHLQRGEERLAEKLDVQQKA